MNKIWGDIEIPVIGITGPHGVGKTLCASAIDPENTAHIDAELSAASYSGIPFKRRFDLFAEMERRGKKDPTPLDAFLCWKDFIDSIKPGEFSVVITDTWDFINNGLHDWVAQHPEKFGKTEAQYAKMSGTIYGDMYTWLHAYTCSTISRTKIQSMVFICHEGAEWKDSKPTTKMKTKGAAVIFKLASLFLNLEKKPDQNGKISAIPSGYTVDTHRGKCRLVRATMVNGELEMLPILPPRMAEATPKAIRAYIAKPADWSKLKKSELAPEVTLSEDDKLELSSQKAADERATEEMKLSRLEQMQKAQKRAATTVTPAPVKEAAAKPAETPPAMKQEPVKETTKQEAPKEAPTTGVTEPAKDASAKPDASGAAQEAPFDSTATTPPAELTDRQVIENQKKQFLDLGATPQQWLDLIGRRKKADGSSCTEIAELSDEQAKEMRAKLGDWLLKKTSGKK